jgi:hypothetical protein
MIPEFEQPRVDQLGESLEVFARDLLILSKTSSVYPKGHPAPQRMATRLAGWAPPGAAGNVLIGVTPSRLLLDGHFFGTKGSRTEAVAAFLHERKIMRLIWTAQVRVFDVIAFTSLLGTTPWTGAELRRELRAANAFSIDVDPLDVSKIHAALRTKTETVVPGKGAEERGRETWLWLQDDAIQPDGIASVLRSDDLWTATEKHAAAVCALLFRHGQGLDEALGRLPANGREEVLARLGVLGNSLPVAEVAKIIDLAAAKPDLGDESLSGLVRDISTDDLVDILAGVVALGGGSTARLARVFRCVAPSGAVDEMLPLIDARFASGENRGVALEVWRALEAFLIGLDEQKFFGDDYVEALETMAQCELQTEDTETTGPFQEDPESHVDWICLTLAQDEGEEEGIGRLRQRLGVRIAQLPIGQLFPLVLAVDRTVPELFSGQPELVHEVFSQMVSSIRLVGRAEQRAVVEFARRHEESILDAALTALLKERRIAGRRLLVELLSSLSAASTAQMVSRARNAPWYFIRNIVTILGRRRERTSVPVLEALLDHPHEKVRREVLRSLGRMGGPGRRIIVRFAGDATRNRRERLFAKGVLDRMGSR